MFTQFLMQLHPVSRFAKVIYIWISANNGDLFKLKDSGGMSTGSAADVEDPVTGLDVQFIKFDRVHQSPRGRRQLFFQPLWTM